MSETLQSPPATDPSAQKVDLKVSIPSPPGEAWEIAATVHLPDPATLTERPPVFVAIPGSGYTRQYFDIPEAGYSEAEHHVRRGTIVIALDHLGVGESSLPPTEVTDMATVAAAGDAAVRSLIDRLGAGTLAEGYPAVTPAAVIGAGQSMGGFILVAMQAHHRTFDAIATLGSSMVATTMPTDPAAPEIEIPPGTSPDEAAMLRVLGTDWRYAFHWEDVPEALVEADLSGGLPIRQTAPVWGSLTNPGLVNSLVLPGVIAAEAASVDVPVLVATGERDVCVSPMEELSAFSSATDRASFVVPRMAHMHNFAGTRELLWARIDAFIDQVCARV